MTIRRRFTLQALGQLQAQGRVDGLPAVAYVLAAN